MRMIPLAAAGLALIAIAAQSDASPRSEAKAKALADARPVGEAVDCLALNDIKESLVRSDQVIDFVTRSGKLYRNTLPNSCAPLGFEERFAYKTSISKLCSLDTITVLQSPGTSRGPTCGLGKFQPIELPKH